MKEEYKIITSLLDINSYSRPGSKMLGIRGVCIHWVGNANSKAINNRNYFNNLKNQTAVPRRYASSHEIIGLDGEVIVCVPKYEVAFHAGAKSYKSRVKQILANSPNRYLYGIETCHPDWGGKFSSVTYKTLVNRVADLLIEFNLGPSKDTIWRHFDVTGKDCPKYYVDNASAWDKLIDDVTEVYYKKTEVLLVAELLEWQKIQGEKALNGLNKKKDINGNSIVNSPEDWKTKLGDNVPGWLFWSIVDRITR